MAKTYTITLELECDSDPSEWVYPEVLVIDEPYRVKKVEENNA
jgi:hypothetical protein